MYESLIISAPMPGDEPQSIAPARPAQSDSPSLFDSLLWKESRGRQLRDDGTPVTSPKGAIGIAQVMPGTAPEAAKLAGLPFDEHRYKTDAEYNKALGRAYFNKQMRDFGDPAKALAAYNAGPGALREAERAAARAGRPDDWLSFLSAETRDYVPAILSRAGLVQRTNSTASDQTPGGHRPVEQVQQIGARTGAGLAQRANSTASGQPPAGPAQQDDVPYYVPMRGKYSSLIVQPPPDRGVFGAVNDTMIEIANAAAGGAGAVASFFSPGNAFSEGVKEFIRSGEESQSDATKAEKARLAEEMQAAEGAGDEVAAYLSYAARNPVLAAAQAAGSFAIPGGAVRGGQFLARLAGAAGGAAAAAGTAGGALAGAALGGGDAAGTAYELVMRTPDEVIARSDDAKQLVAGGLSIQEAKAELAKRAARSASAIPAVVGALSGTVGAERLLAGAGRAGSRASQAARTALVEGSTEAFEEGITAYEGQSAAARYNPEIDPMKGVAGAATAGAVMGAGIGGVVGAISGPDQQPGTGPAATDPALAPVAKAAAEGGIASRAVLAGEQARREAASALPPPPPAAPEIDQIGEAASVIRAKSQEAGLLDALRSAESPVAVKQFLQDLSIAASPSARRDLREQALTRIEFAAAWAEQNAPARPAAMPDAIAPVQVGTDAAPSERGARPTLQQMQAAVDRDASLTDAAGTAAATRQAETLMAEAQRLEQAATLIESQPAVGATEMARSGSMRERAAVLRQRASEVSRRATQAPATRFDREQVEAQRQTMLEQRLRRPAAPAAAPATEAEAGITPTEQARLESAALAGNELVRREEDAPRRAVVDRALRAVEERGGVASPAEAAIFAEAGVGRPYDRIDESLPGNPEDYRTAGVAVPSNAQPPSAGAGISVVAGGRGRDQDRLERMRSSVEPVGDRPFASLTASQAPLGRGPAGNEVDLAPDDLADISGLGLSAGAPAAAPTLQRAPEDVADISGLGLVPRQSADRAAAPAAPADRTAPPAPRAPDADLRTPAYVRKRRQTLSSLAAAGFGRVERRDDKFFMVSRSGQEFQLDGAGDAQLARQAIEANRRASIEQANTDPTDGQKEAGNYRKGRAEFDGIELLIENPIGSTRSGKAPDGTEWSVTMSADYGYVRGTKAADGDAVDVYLARNPRSGSPVFVFDQVNDDGSFDETKAVLGAPSLEAAAAIYDAHFSDGSGPRRRSGHRSMSAEEFVQWAKSDDARKPVGEAPLPDVAAQVKPQDDVGSEIVIRVDGRNVSLRRESEDSMPESPSTERDKRRARKMTKSDAKLIRSIASMFGKNVVFYSASSSFSGDGFTRPGDPNIYIRNATTINPVAVFGHELMHQVRAENMAAYDAIAAVVRTRVNNPDAYRRYYGSQGDGALSEERGGDLEELVADLGGNLMMEPSFWRDVFAEIGRRNGDNSRGIIARLAAQIEALIARAVAAIKQGRYRSEEFVNDIESIKKAFRDGMADYLTSSGVTVASMRADILRASRSRDRDQTDTPEFKSWFKDSKAVDEDGRPLVVYHGTGSDFSVFDNNTWRSRSVGFYFTTEPSYAALYARTESLSWRERDQLRGNIIPAYLSAQKPMEMDGEQWRKIEHGPRPNTSVLDIFDAGYDSIRVRDFHDTPGREMWVVRLSNQIKSAIGNRGTFDPGDADITRSADRSPAVGIHFSRQPRTSISGAYYGTGLKGAEAARLERTSDTRLKSRTYFYVDEGRGVRPEAGVGGVAHEVDLPRLYDAKANPDGLWNSGDINATETRILDAGYDGYWVKNHETGQGLAVVIGPASLRMPARQVGARIIGPDEQKPEPIKRGLMSSEISAIDVSNIPGAKVRAGTLTVPPESVDAANAEMERIGSPVRFSRDRAESLERVHPMEMSTRAPSAKRVDDPEDPMKSLLISDFASAANEERWLASVSDLVRSYPNYREAASAGTPDRVLERAVRQMVDNLVWLHDMVPPNTRARSKLWYDGARSIAERWSRKYGITDAQAAGILAVLSPQKDWFMNVSLANRVADIMSDRQSFRWSAAMDETAARIFGADAYQEDVEAIRGQSLRDIDDDYLRAMWLRVFDQAHNPSSFYIVSPEGEFVAEARTKDGALGRVAWGGNSTIAKAISIFKDGTAENISSQLGRKHKVRNFYNNILVPNSPNGHVTIDTHAVAAALLRPLSGFSDEVMHNFGGPKSARAGLEGTYPLYEEAYRRASAQRSLLPREMQSITWEAVRGLFAPKFKSNQDNVDAVDAVWRQYSKGRLSYEKARQQVIELAGGIAPPGWEGRDAGAYVEDEQAADTGNLPENGVPAGDSRGDAGGARIGSRAAAVRSSDRVGDEAGDPGRADPQIDGATAAPNGAQNSVSDAYNSRAEALRELISCLRG